MKDKKFKFGDKVMWGDNKCTILEHCCQCGYYFIVDREGTESFVKVEKLKRGWKK